jgi:hypothetical protein
VGVSKTEANPPEGEMVQARITEDCDSGLFLVYKISVSQAVELQAAGVAAVEVARRYSEFEALHEQLVRDELFLELEVFLPEKHLMGNAFASATFLADRLAMLNDYLQGILQFDSFSHASRTLVLEFLSIKWLVKQRVEHLAPRGERTVVILEWDNADDANAIVIGYRLVLLDEEQTTIWRDEQSNIDVSETELLQKMEDRLGPVELKMHVAPTGIQQIPVAVPPMGAVFWQFSEENEEPCGFRVLQPASADAISPRAKRERAVQSKDQSKVRSIP